MALPYIILVLGYTLLAGLFLWVAISIKKKWILKFSLVPAILWFGLFLYYVPPQLAGYPSDQEVIEERVIVRFFTYKAPTQTEEGEIYIVVDTRFYPETIEKALLDKLDPKTYTDISKSEYLRLYRLPWDEDLVKQMNKANKQKKLITLRKNRPGGPESKSKKKSDRKGPKAKGDKVGKENEDGKGGTGGTAKNSKDLAKYWVEALTPNEVFTK